jgi:hypothetical protein
MAKAERAMHQPRSGSAMSATRRGVAAAAAVSCFHDILRARPGAAHRSTTPASAVLSRPRFHRGNRLAFTLQFLER